MQIYSTYVPLNIYVKKYFIYSHNNSVQVHVTHHACTAFQLLIKTVGVLSLENRITCPHVMAWPPATKMLWLLNVTAQCHILPTLMSPTKAHWSLAGM